MRRGFASPANTPALPVTKQPTIALTVHSVSYLRMKEYAQLAVGLVFILILPRSLAIYAPPTVLNVG